MFFDFTAAVPLNLYPNVKSIQWCSFADTKSLSSILRCWMTKSSGLEHQSGIPNVGRSSWIDWKIINNVLVIRAGYFHMHQILPYLKYCGIIEIIRNAFIRSPDLHSSYWIRIFCRDPYWSNKFTQRIFWCPSSFVDIVSDFRQNIWDMVRSLYIVKTLKRIVHF